MTPPELRLWLAIRRRACAGAHFRRQHPIGPYVLDFYCDQAKLAVEVDGRAHDVGGAPERDARRDRWLADREIRTLRFSAEEVRINLDGVFRTIEAAVSSPSGGSPAERGWGL